MITKVSDHIETLVHFQNGQIKPFRFLWKNHAYRINSITTQYQLKDGNTQNLIFAVQSGTNIYKLIYDLKHHTWYLTEIHAD